MIRRCKTFSLLAVFTILFSFEARAGLLLEPYVGFSLSGDMEQAAKGANSKIEGEHGGLTLGGRLGFQSLGLMVGLQYDLGLSTELDSKQGTATAKDDIKRTHIGAFVGYNFPVMVRAWGTYYFSSKVEGDEAPTADITGDVIDSTQTWKGNGYALGVGFTGLPIVSLNLEYRSYEYDEIEDAGADLKLDPSVEASEIMISVSAPLTF